MIKHLEKETDFYDIVAKETCIVDFYADWCGPCKMLLPVLDEIDFTDIYKVNVDEYPEIAKKFGIMSIPTLVFFKDGLEQEREIGYRGLDEIKATFKSIQ
ncbi:MAG: thiol reductase thioredoxin [Firmicutes bacterium]|nr:thiol reductase thioredoxin [Bacillota bacterium]